MKHLTTDNITPSSLQPMPRPQLERMIEAYMNATLNEEQEVQLAQQLAITPHHSEAIDEARAVMGYYSMGQAVRRHINRRRTRRRVLAAAASVTLLAIIGWSWWHHANLTPSAGDCMALVNGQTVTDDAVVMELLTSDLNAMGDAQAAVEDNMMNQLHSLGAALDDDNQQSKHQ